MTSNISPSESVSGCYDCRVKGLDLCRALPVCVSWWWFLRFHTNKIEQLRTTWYQPFILRRSKCFSDQQMDSKPKCAQVLPTCARQPNLGTIRIAPCHSHPREQHQWSNTVHLQFGSGKSCTLISATYQLHCIYSRKISIELSAPIPSFCCLWSTWRPVA